MFESFRHVSLVVCVARVWIDAKKQEEREREGSQQQRQQKEKDGAFEDPFFWLI
jgi:hypothetical protein